MQSTEEVEVSDEEYVVEDESDESESEYDEIDKLSRQLLFERDGQMVEATVIGVTETHYDRSTEEKTPYVMVETEFEQVVCIKFDPSDEKSWVFNLSNGTKEINDFYGSSLDLVFKDDSTVTVNGEEAECVRKGQLEDMRMKYVSNEEVKSKLPNDTLSMSTQVDGTLFNNEWIQTHLMMNYGDTGVPTKVGIKVSGKNLIITPETSDCNETFTVKINDDGTWDKYDGFCQLVDAAGGFDHIKSTNYYLYKKSEYYGEAKSVIASSNEWILLANPYEKRNQQGKVEKYVQDNGFSVLSFVSLMGVMTYLIGLPFVGLAGFAVIIGATRSQFTENEEDPSFDEKIE